MLLLECLRSVPDPRRAQGRRYELRYILLYAVLAVLAGAISCRRIQRFMDIHRKRLNAVFGTLWKQAPAHTAVRYILQGLNEQDLPLWNLHCAGTAGPCCPRRKSPRGCAGRSMARS